MDPDPLIPPDADPLPVAKPQQAVPPDPQPLPTPESHARRAKIIQEVQQQFASPAALDQSKDLYKQVGEGQFQTGGDPGAAAHAAVAGETLAKRLKAEAPEHADDIPELRKAVEDQTKEAGRAHMLATFKAAASQESDAGLRIGKVLPWVRHVQDVGYYASLNSAIKSYEKGDAGPNDYAMIARHLAREEKEQQKGAVDTTADFLKTLPATILEFGKAGELTAGAAEKIAGKLGISAGEVAAKAGIQKLLATAGRAAVQGAAITAVSPAQLAAGTLQRQTPGLDLGEEGLQVGERPTVFSAAAKAAGSALTSNTIFSGAGVFSKTGVAKSYLGHLAESVGALQADKEAQRAFGGAGGLLSNLVVGSPEQRQRALGEFTGEVLGLGLVGTGTRAAERIDARQKAVLKSLPEGPVKDKVADVIDKANGARQHAEVSKEAETLIKEAVPNHEIKPDLFKEILDKTLPTLRPNADLDAAMKEEPAKPPAPAPGELRHNPDLDAMMGEGNGNQTGGVRPAEQTEPGPRPQDRQGVSGQTPEGAAHPDAGQTPEGSPPGEVAPAEPGRNATNGQLAESDRGQGRGTEGSQPGVAGEPGAAGATKLPGAEPGVLKPFEPFDKVPPKTQERLATLVKEGDRVAVEDLIESMRKHFSDEDVAAARKEAGTFPKGVEGKTKKSTKIGYEAQHEGGLRKHDVEQQLLEEIHGHAAEEAAQAGHTPAEIEESSRSGTEAGDAHEGEASGAKTGVEPWDAGPDTSAADLARVRATKQFNESMLKKRFEFQPPAEPAPAKLTGAQRKMAGMLRKIGEGRVKTKARPEGEPVPPSESNLRGPSPSFPDTPEGSAAEKAWMAAQKETTYNPAKHEGRPGSTRAEGNFGKSIKDFVQGESGSGTSAAFMHLIFGSNWAEQARKAGMEVGAFARSVRNGVSAAAYPNTHRLSRVAGEALAEHGASKIAAEPIANDLHEAVFGVDPKNAANIMAVIVENRLRGENDKLTGQGQPAAFESKVGPNGIWATEADYQASLHSPEVQAGIHRWNDKIGSWMNEQYRSTAGLQAGDPVPVHGRDFEAPVNLLNVEHEGDFAKSGGPNPNNPRANYSMFRKRAKGGEVEYSVDPEAILHNTVSRVYEKATRIRAIEALDREGVGKLVKTGDPIPDKIHGEDPYRLTVEMPGKGGMETMGLYLPRSLKEEVTQAMNTDMRLGKNALLRAANALQMFGIGDISFHSVNLPLWMAQAPGGKNLAYELAVRGMPGLRTLDAVARPIIKLISGKVNPEAAAEQWANISRVGAGRGGEKEGGGLLSKPHELLVAWDKANRMALDDLYTNLVDRKLMDDTDSSRRDFINNYSGIYNPRMMNKIGTALKDTGASPFYTAVSTGLRVGTQAIHGGYGGEAASLGAAAQLRSTQLFKNIVTPIAIGALGTLALTGKLWQAGVPMGAIATGGTDDEGKPKYIDLMGAARRGVDDTGIGAIVDSALRGRGAGQTVDAVAKDVTHAATHFVGPGPKFVFAAATGRRLAHGLPPTAGGSSEADEGRAPGQVMRALKEQNPMIAGALEANEKGTSVMAGLGKSGVEAGKKLIGLRSGRPPVSPAVELAQAFARGSTPDDPTAASIESSRAKRELRDQVAAGDKDKLQEAFKAGSISRLEAQHIDKTAKMEPIQRVTQHLPLQAALRVYGVATEEEQKAMLGLLRAKYRATQTGLHSLQSRQAAVEAWKKVFPEGVAK